MTKKEKEFLQKLYDLGVCLQVNYFDGYNTLHVCIDDVQEIQKNIDKWIANKCGVSEQHYKDYIKYNFNHDGRCTGTTLKGKRCKNLVHNQVFSPSEYKKGQTDRCDLHQE